MIPSLFLFATLAGAELPPPDYGRELARMQWHQVNGTIERACTFSDREVAWVCDDDDVREAIGWAKAFNDTVFADAGLEYLVGYGHRVLGEEKTAEHHYRTSTRLDPEYETAWYDLGELLLTQGRFDEAEAAFVEVDRLRPSGPNAWVGPWRLAEVAAHKEDPDAFERHLKEALRRGFTFRQVAGLPNWRGFYANPALRSVIDKLVTVYGDPSILESLSEERPDHTQ